MTREVGYARLTSGPVGANLPELVGGSHSWPALVQAGSNTCKDLKGQGMEAPGVRTITKKELTERIADRTGQSRAAVKRTLQDFFDEVVSELTKGNRIEFRDFGVFEVKVRAPRTAQNPRTLERVRVPERKSVKFKPGRRMRDQIEKVETAPIIEPKAGVRPRSEDIADDAPELANHRAH